MELPKPDRDRRAHQGAVHARAGEPVWVPLMDASGPVERRVTRIVTPGTLTDSALLPASRESLLAAVSLSGVARPGLPRCASEGLACVPDPLYLVRLHLARTDPRAIG